MLWLIVQILLVGYVPGALMLRLPGRSRAYRSALPADERLFWSVLLSVVWSTMVVVGLGLLDRYAHERLLTINAVVAVMTVVALGTRLPLARPLSRPPLAALVPAAIVAAGLWLYFPPFEYVIGGRDPGSYLNEGVQIAQRGQIVIRDDVIASVPVPFRDLFFPSHELPTYYGLRFMGFFIQSPDDGTVIGQWPHLFPASAAIGYGLNGLTGARQAIGVWAILGLLAVYFTGARLFGRTVAGVATALLAINVLTVWFGRYPNSELPMQTLLFAALLAAGRARTGGGTFFAVAAGALLGLTLFLRYEILLAIMAFAGAAVLAPVSRQRLGWSFGAALVLTGSAGAWYLLDPLRAYSRYPVLFVSDRGGWMLVLAGLAAAIVTHRLLRIDAIGQHVRRWLPMALAAVVALLAVYAYFVRDEGGRLALGDAMAFRSFGWYLTPPLLAAAVAGTVFFVARDLWRDPTFYLTFVTFSGFFFYKTRIVPEHFWTGRRFLTMALPGALLMAAAIVRELLKPEHLARLTAWRRGPAASVRPSRWLAVASVVLTVAVLTPTARAFWRASAPVARHVEYAGLIPHLEQLAARIGDRDLLIVEGRNAGTDLHVFAVPLAYIYARNVLVLDSPVPDKRTFELFAAWARSRYDRVLFLGGGGTDLLSQSIAAEPLAMDRIEVPEYDAPLNAYPRAPRTKKFGYGLYQLVDGRGSAGGPVDVQLGVFDDLNVVRFHAHERRGDLDFRWSGVQSFVVLPRLDRAARELTIWMGSGGRPASAPPAAVEVAIDNEVIGSVIVGDEVEPFAFTLPPALVERLAATADPVWVRLRVTTWQPAALVGGGDTRELGVMVTRVQAR